MHNQTGDVLSGIQRVADISYEDFVEKFLSENLPCVLDESHTRSWKSRREWVVNGKPCFEFLKKCFGAATVPVADCNKVEYASHPKQSMLFKDFIDYWEQQCENCKVPNDAYQTPAFFQSDWLNEFWDAWTDKKDDYRFVYMGPKGTWTPLHADVFRSYSWSANICGKKKWILYPPGQEQYLKDVYGNLIFDLTSSETKDRNKFPTFDKASKPLIVEQNEGEIIFVPSCWHHQVINKDDTISINHNWINGSGVSWTWQHLKDELQLVKRSIDDCRNMDGWASQCQVILQANSGINFQGFFKLLASIACSRLIYLTAVIEHHSAILDELQLLSLSLETNFCLNTPLCPHFSRVLAKEKKYDSLELCLFDLQKVKDVLDKLTVDEDVDNNVKTPAMALLSCLTKVIVLARF